MITVATALSPIRNIFVNHDVGATEARSGPIYDLLSHNLHAAAASGSAEFWICVSRIQSFRDRNRTIGWGLGYGHRDAPGIARTVPERWAREHQVRARIDCACNLPERSLLLRARIECVCIRPVLSLREYLGQRNVGNEQRTCCGAEQQCNSDRCTCHD